MSTTTLARLFGAAAITIAAVVATGAAAAPAGNDDARPLADVVDLDATVTSDVVPDTAVVTMAIVREGPDVAPLTADVNQALAKAFADAKSVSGVAVSNGGYTTQPRYDSRGSSGASTRTGWQVRAQIVLKSKNFDALGSLVGRLSQTLQIAGSGFEISPELRAQEGAALIDRGARAFAEKAQAATRAFSYSGYSVRRITIGNTGAASTPRPMTMMRAEAAPSSAPPLPLEAGVVTLSLTVSGSLQMRK